MKQDYTGKKYIRLFCDGCGGKNKNSHIVHVLIFFFVNHAPPEIEDIQITYPVRGHSFLPADRVFGRLEKEISKFPVITSKDEYLDKFSQFGDVSLLGKDWKLFDLKQLCKDYKKST